MLVLVFVVLGHTHVKQQNLKRKQKRVQHVVWAPTAQVVLTVPKPCATRERTMITTGNRLNPVAKVAILAGSTTKPVHLSVRHVALGNTMI